MSEGRCVITKNFMIIYVENFSHLIIIFIKIVTDFFFFLLHAGSFSGWDS